MVRPSFIKSLGIDGDYKMTIKDWIVELVWYNQPMIFFRKLGRFLKRLPKWLKLCWNSENWDFSYMYDYIEMWLNELKGGLQKDTWHEQHCVKRAIQQIDCTLGHLDRYRNWPNYWEWPEPEHVKLPDGCYTLKYKPEDEPQCELVHRMEQKHYDKFWYMLKKYHGNWWT